MSESEGTNPPREEFLSARTRRSRRDRRTLQLLLRSRCLWPLARILGLWPAWRRNCARGRPDGRFARRPLCRRGRSCLCSGEFGAFFQPRLIILRCIDHQCAFHSVMAEAAQLAANHFIAPSLNWRKPDRNQRTRDRVASDAHVGQKEIVDNIFRGKLCDHGSIDRHMKFARRNDVVLASRIIWIKAERV